MKPFSLRSERFSAEGSISAGAIRRNMGRSSLDSLSLLVREAVQNSWDARIDREGGGVSISLHLGTLGRGGADVLQRTVFKELPPEHPLSGHLTPESGILCIKDTGTVGLNGPVFHVPRKGEIDDRSRNFIRFVRDIGRGASKQLTGGTYGFGKSTFHVVSEAATILVYTRCVDEATHEREDRIIALSVWNPTEDERYTGRHWWGERKPEGIAPLTGEKAVELAEAIGLPKFKRSESGTVIAMIAPRFVSPYQGVGHDTARALAESLTTWFWPRMLNSPDGRPWIDFSVFYQGREIPVPSPLDLEPFRTMSGLLGGLAGPPPAAGRTTDICSEKPKATLGRMAAAPLTDVQPSASWKSLAIDGHVLGELLDRPGGLHARCHHIALMRSTWQVIRYLPCRPVRANGHGFAGVFLVDGDSQVEMAFANSEPPAHDDWLPDSLDDDWHRRYVRIALRRIREMGDDLSSSIDAQAVIGHGPDLSRLSRLLGRAMPGSVEARRKVPAASADPAARKQDKLGVQLIDQGNLGMLEGRRTLSVSFAVTGTIPASGVTINASPRVVVVGGGTEHDGDDSLDRPFVIGWRGSDGRMIRQDQLRLAAGAPVEWQVVVQVPDEAQVGVSIQVAGRAGR